MTAPREPAPPAPRRPGPARRRFLGGAGVAAAGALAGTGEVAGACADPAGAPWPPARGPAVHDIVDHGAVSEEMRAAPPHRDLDDAEVAARNLAAVQGAMAAIEASGGGTLYVPSGRFAVRADCDADRIIVLVDHTTVLFAPGARLVVRASERVRYFVIHGEGVTDVAVVGAHLEGAPPAASLTDGFGIYLVACERATIRGCQVTGMLKDGLYLRDLGGEPTRGVTVAGSVFEDCGRQGATLSGVYDVSFVGCTFRRNGGLMAGRSGLVLEPQYNLASENRYVRVVGCRFEENARFGLLVAQKNPSEAVVVCASELVGNPAAGISAGGPGPRYGVGGSPPGRGSGLVVHGNHVSGNGGELGGDGGGIRVGSPDAVASGNSCHDNRVHELWVNVATRVQHASGDGGDVGVPVSGCALTGNRLVPGPGGGLALGFHDRRTSDEHVIAHNLASEG